jgi:hypothetical protein
MGKSLPRPNKPSAKPGESQIGTDSKFMTLRLSQPRLVPNAQPCTRKTYNTINTSNRCGWSIHFLSHYVTEKMQFFLNVTLVIAPLFSEICLPIFRGFLL